MDEERVNWPIVVGLTAGIIGGIVAGVVLYYVKYSHDPEQKIRDAREIISHCHDKIKEIESGIDAIKKPLLT